MAALSTEPAPVDMAPDCNGGYLQRAALEGKRVLPLSTHLLWGNRERAGATLRDTQDLLLAQGSVLVGSGNFGLQGIKPR